VHAHFFIPEEIELDISPDEVTGAAEHAAVLDFLESLSNRIGKELILSLENHLVEPLATYQPNRRVWK
jgi:hypothetical protein